MQLQWHGRSPTNRFCRWIVVCFMCAHEISYVYSHVCVKTPCFDDNLVRYLHISAFGTFSRQSSSKVPTRHVTVWFCEPKFCERKRTCLVGALCNVIGILSTTYKVCVMRCYTLCGIAQGSCRDRSPWAYLYDPRSGAHYSSWRWVGVLRQLHLTPGILDSDAGTPLSTLSESPLRALEKTKYLCFRKCLYDMDCCTTALYLLVLSWLKTKPKSR
jgi:hypothetical protein